MDTRIIISLKNFFLISFVIISLVPAPVFAQENPGDQMKENVNSSKKNETNWSIDYLDYEQRVFSSSDGVEATDRIEIEAAVKYQLSENTFLRFRIKTIDDPYSYGTGSLEAIINQKYSNFELQVDTQLNLDQGYSENDGHGGMLYFFDQDSEYTYLKYTFQNAGLTFSLHPFNLDSEVGNVLPSGDIATIYVIEGAPSSTAGASIGDAEIVRRKAPGLVCSFSLFNKLSVYAGAGALRYYYPTGNFDIETGSGADQWEAKTDIAFKFGTSYISAGNIKTTFEFAGHTQTEETGALQAYAASLMTNGNFGPLYVEAEGSFVQTGKAPYNISVRNKWFRDTTPYYPVYADEFGNKQDWIDSSDFGVHVLAGYRLGPVMPFASFRMLGEHFVFYDNYYYPESAHRLRTADKSKSHGGLQVLGAGLNWQLSGNFKLKTLFEYKIAANEVFSKTGDIRSDDTLESKDTTEMVLTLSLTYIPE